MKISLKNVSLMLDGTLVTLATLNLVADEADLVAEVTVCQAGTPLDQPRSLGVFVCNESATVSDRTPDNAGACAHFTMRDNAAELDDPGMRAELSLSDEAEKSWGMAQFGELWFPAGMALPSIVYQPDKATVEESGY